MKRRIALVLALVMLCTLVIPLQSFAAGIDQSLEKAINIAKDKFPIPSDYKFQNNISTDGGKTVFNLTWTSKDNTDGSSINVQINEDGKILSYNNYSPSDYSQMKRLPKVSKEEAKIKADAFIKMVDSTLLPQVNYKETTQNNLMDSTYYFTYYRVVNGVPFYNSYVNVNVNRDSGKIQGYYLQWTDDLVFPAPGKQIDVTKAQEAYTNNLGLKLIYKYSYVDDKVKTYAVYVPKYANETYAVDAFTGDRIQLDYGYGPYFNYAMDQKMEMAKATSASGGPAPLNPDEQKAVLDAAKLKSVDEAEKAARVIKFLGLTDEFKMTNSYLNTNWPLRDEYTWSLNFNKAAKNDTDVAEYVSAGINASTGELVNFYRSAPYQQGAKPKYDQAAAKSAVEAFLTENYPEKFKQVEFDQLYTDNYVRNYGTDKPSNFSFRYNRLVNGIAFPDNGLNIEFDAVNGIITSFNMNWFNITFVPVDKVLPIDSAYQKLFSNIGLELQYKSKLPEVDYSKMIINPSTVKPDMKLVYALETDKPLFLDANTGVVLDYNGDPFKEVKPVAYTDIKDSYAQKQIMVLAENGVYLDGTEFKPNSEITQKDFFILLSKTMSYYGPVLTPMSTQTDIDNLYAFLTREGVLKAGEKAPDSAVTREDAVKFIIRAMKYDKVADIKGIYKDSFKDNKSISPSLTGYVAIAAGLKIMSGTNGYFYPKSKLKRADAAIMIYNYLQV